MFTFSEKPGIACLNNRLHGNIAGIPASYTVFYAESGRMEELTGDSPQVRCIREDTQLGVLWHVVLQGEAEKQIRLEIHAVVSQAKATFSLRVLSEAEGFYLVTVRLEGLAAVEAGDPQARVALPMHGGRLIDPAHVADGAIDHGYNWIRDSFGSCALAYTDGLTAVVRVHAMDDQLTSRVGDGENARYAQLGAVWRYRYTQLDVSYRRAKRVEDTDCDNLQSYPVAQHFSIGTPGEITVELLQGPAMPVESGWVPGARHVFASLPNKPCDMYRGHMVYKVFVGSPADGLRTSYAQAAEILRQVHARTGGAQQILYIVGFQNEGHDDRYPDVFTPNTVPGSETALHALIDEALALGSIVSFHDNYDDAYMESATFDEDIIARDNQGHLLRGGVWNGKQAYWISLPQYAGPRSEVRITRTLARYPFLCRTYHLDVLTASVFRVDFRQDAPAGKQADLQARKRLLRQFAVHGLDVSSEACGLPFVGAISYFWHMQRIPRCVYEGDRRIPMIPFLAHGKADYAGTHTDHPSEILDGLLYGGFFCNDITADTPIKTLTDAYFMLQAPLDALRDEAAVSYAEEGGWKQVTYESGASVAVNFETLECRVDIESRRWIENGTAMIPQADGSTLLYVAWEEPYSAVVYPCALKAGESCLAVPVGVDAETVTLTATEQGLPVDLPAGIAYRIGQY